MRVLSIGNLFPPAASGGYERLWVDGVRALLAAGHDVRVLTTDAQAPEPGPGGVPEAFRELRWYWRDHAFVEVGWRERLRLERANAAVLAGHLEEFRPDAVGWWALGGMSLSLLEQVRRARIPAVGVVADGWMVYGPEHDAWTRAWRGRPRLGSVAERLTGIPARLDLGAAAHWLFISEATRERALREGYAFPSSELAHAGVDPAAFPAAPARDWAWELACVGRVHATKGIATAVEALAALPKARLTISGAADPAHRMELDELASRLGVTERVRFRQAPFDEIARAYADADALLFPVTWPEPWGLVPLEAMQVGRPVVATGTGGSGEYLADGENCLLFEPGDAAALAAAVECLAADPQLCERLVAGGRRTAARFTASAFDAAVVRALEAVA